MNSSACMHVYVSLCVCALLHVCLCFRPYLHVNMNHVCMNSRPYLHTLFIHIKGKYESGSPSFLPEGWSQDNVGCHVSWWARQICLIRPIIASPCSNREPFKIERETEYCLIFRLTSCSCSPWCQDERGDVNGYLKFMAQRPPNALLI